MVRSSERTTYVSQRPDEHGRRGVENLIKDGRVHGQRVADN